MAADSSSSGPVSLQWSLNETSSNILAVSRGLLKAATCDNVQPIALLAAEAFGTTLPMSSRTLMIVEKVAGKRHVSAVLEFMQAQVGWSANDSACLLASSDAGLRFLSLTAALITSNSSFEAARTLEQLIRNSSMKNELLPTLGQLQDLVDALSPKLIQAGFADKLVGAEILINALTSPDRILGRKISDITIPATEQVSALVEAMKKMHRLQEIGTETAPEQQRMIITTDYSHAWVFAFAEWMSGCRPALVDKSGEPLLPQEQRTTMTLSLSRRSDNSIPMKVGRRQSSMKIELFHSIHAPPELWECPAETQAWRGFLSLSEYGRHRLHCSAIDIDESSKINAICQAIQSTIALLAKCSFISSVAAEFAHYQWPVLPPERDMLDIFTTLLGQKPKKQLPRLDSYSLIWDLPLLRNVLEKLQQECQCLGCGYSTSQSSFCQVEELKTLIIELTAEIISLALFEDDESSTLKIQVNNSHGRPVEQSQLTYHIEDFMNNLREVPPVMTRNLRHIALQLVGMSDAEESLAAYTHGQVVFFAFLEDPALRRVCIERMRCVAGQLRFENETATTLRGTETEMRTTVQFTQPVDKPCNLSGGSKVRWLVSRDPGSLTLAMTLDCSNGGTIVANPMNVLYSTPNSLLVSRCEHDRDIAMAEPDNQAYYVSPACDTSESDEAQDAPGIVQVIAVANNEQQRFCALHPFRRRAL